MALGGNFSITSRRLYIFLLRDKYNIIKWVFFDIKEAIVKGISENLLIERITVSNDGSVKDKNSNPMIIFVPE